MISMNFQTFPWFSKQNIIISIKFPKFPSFSEQNIMISIKFQKFPWFAMTTYQASRSTLERTFSLPT